MANQTSLLPINVSLLLTPTRGNFVPFYICLCLQKLQPSSDKKYTTCSEHRFIFNKTTHLFIHLLHCTKVNIFRDDLSHLLNKSNQHRCDYKSICEILVVQAQGSCNTLPTKHKHSLFKIKAGGQVAKKL